MPASDMTDQGEVSPNDDTRGVSLHPPRVLDAIEGADRSAGARLVYVGTSNKSVALRAQPALAPEPDGSSWASALVEGAADTMASARFAAHPNDLCPMCPVRRSCPLQPEGREVVA